MVNTITDMIDKSSDALRFTRKAVHNGNFHKCTEADM